MAKVDTKSRAPDYADLDLDFIRKPGNGDITKKIGEEGIKRAVRNLILTNFYDRLFNPRIGGNVQKQLFENFSPLSAKYLEVAIREVIRNWEPRIELIDVISTANEDENGYYTRITYRVKNRPEPKVIDIFLERIR